MTCSHPLASRKCRSPQALAVLAGNGQSLARRVSCDPISGSTLVALQSRLHGLCKAWTHAPEKST